MTITSQLSTALADRYRIERHLGEGGMATVYLAQDLKHDRKVALKVLRPELAAVIGAERFLNEIKVTANLQHPHILPLHDSGEAGSFLYYVMPYVEGDTLRDKLKRERQLDIDEAVALTRGVAAALDYAHRQGVIHRDIKPENILIHDGQALVADFGIALAVSHASGQRLTETGLSIGTPHYMSPEQAMGDRELDARSDVYSLGAMLYEMLTGDPPYTGTSAQAIVAKVITEKAPPVTAARDTVPGHVAAAVGKALQKMPADRFRSAADFASALANPGFATAVPAVPAVDSAVPPFRRSAVTALLAASAILATALAAWGWLRSEPAPVTRLDLSLGGIQPAGGELAISADGRMLAVSGTRDGEQAIFVRRLGDADFQKVPGTETGRDPSFSPDGEWLVFRNDGERSLVRVAVAGGGTLTLVSGADFNPFFPHWGTDETIAFLSPGGTHVVSASGGAPRRLGGGISPHLLPDGSGVLATRDGAVYLLPLDGDSAAMLVPDAGHATYVRTGHLLYVAGSGGLFAVPFDLGRHAVTGTPVRVLDRVATTALVPGYWVSRDGTLVHHEGAFGGVTFGGGGAPTLLAVGSWEGGLDTLRLPSARRFNPRFSPDGRSIVYESFESARGGETDIYTFDLVTNTRTQITFAGDNDDPVWSPDGRRILYNLQNDSTDGEDLWIKPADNSGPAEQVLRRPGNQWPVAWPTADRIVFASVEAAGTDLHLLASTDGATPEPYLQAPWNEVDAAVSPDGTLAAHTSNKNGTLEVWLRDFPTPRGEWRVSPDRPGQQPRWAPDGRTLYFLRYGQGGSIDTIFAAAVNRTSGVVVQAAQPRFVGNVLDWDLHPAGDRFIVVLQTTTGPAEATAEAGSGDRRLVVLNWFEELKARVGR